MKNLLFILLCVPLLVFSQDEKRLALVIGNANYDKGELKNPVNDALLISATLKKLDFDVILDTNLADKRSFKETIREFGNRRPDYDVAFVYYAGHGIQVGSKNYLLPTKEVFESEYDVQDYGVSVQDIMRYLTGMTNQVNILILDACRDNPFEGNWNATRSLKGDGLAKIPPPAGSLIAFSTDAGNTAADGDGKNSIYCESLSKHLLKPNTEIKMVFQNVRADVLKSTDGYQSPVENSKLTGDAFYLLIKKDARNINIEDIFNKAEALFENQDYEESRKKCLQIIYQLENDTTSTLQELLIKSRFLLAEMSNHNDAKKHYIEITNLTRKDEDYSKAYFRWIRSYKYKMYQDERESGVPISDSIIDNLLNQISSLIQFNNNNFGDNNYRNIASYYEAGVITNAAERFEEARENFLQAISICDKLRIEEKERLFKYHGYANVIYYIYKWYAEALFNIVWYKDFNKDDDFLYAENSSLYFDKAIENYSDYDFQIYEEAAIKNQNLRLALDYKHQTNEKELEYFFNKSKGYYTKYIHQNIFVLDTISNILNKRGWYENEYLNGLDNISRNFQNIGKLYINRNVDTLNMYCDSSFSFIQNNMKDNEYYPYLSSYSSKNLEDRAEIINFNDSIHFKNNKEKLSNCIALYEKAKELIPIKIKNQKTNWFDAPTDKEIFEFYLNYDDFLRENYHQEDTFAINKRIELAEEVKDYLTRHPKILSYYPDWAMVYDHLAVLYQDNVEKSYEYNKKSVHHFFKHYYSWSERGFLDEYEKIEYTPLKQYYQNVSFSDSYEMANWISKAFRRNLSNYIISIDNLEIVDSEKIRLMDDYFKISSDFISTNINYLKSSEVAYIYRTYLETNIYALKLSYELHLNQDMQIAEQIKNKILETFSLLSDFNESLEFEDADTNSISTQKGWESYVKNEKSDFLYSINDDNVLDSYLEYYNFYKSYKPNDLTVLAEITSNIAKLSKKSSAITYYKKSINYLESLIDEQLKLPEEDQMFISLIIKEKAIMQSAIGELTNSEKDILISIISFKEALEILEDEVKLHDPKMYNQYKLSLYYNIADRYYLLNEYADAIENYKSALLFCEREDYEKNAALYEELILNYRLINDYENANVIYTKVLINLDSLFGQQFTFDYQIDTIKVGIIAIPILSLNILTQENIYPVIMFDVNQNNIVDASIDRKYTVNKDNELMVYPLNRLITEDLLFEGKYMFNFFDEEIELDKGFSELKKQNQMTNNLVKWKLIVPISDIAPANTNQVNFAVNLIQKNPLNRVFPIDGSSYRSEYRVDTYPSPCRFYNFKFSEIININ